MSTAEKVEYEDKVPEQVMAALLGITYRALQTRRSKRQIPEGVWNKVTMRFFSRCKAMCSAVKSRLSGVPIRTNSHRLVQKLVQGQRSDS
ncbi:TPA: hypothetical protein L4T80_005077 [Pseudomonas aeruginosa]|nr:hypothetical protein [Pseudomonas aeruginosa]HBO3217411.1 hypothetical protein [Pseudomonas aeruginosa]HBO3223766.1 hypothetical protein [Pseudomonas aeruginosa]HBO3255733.1 hypothetical protein [Pseudomonas aeruginosa]HBO3395482.1 hypothetical protein [Pseudomonas aeruginosa]